MTIEEAGSRDEEDAPQVQCSLDSEAGDEPSANGDLVQTQADAFGQDQMDALDLIQPFQGPSSPIGSPVLHFHAPLLMDVDATTSSPPSPGGDNTNCFIRGESNTILGGDCQQWGRNRSCDNSSIVSHYNTKASKEPYLEKLQFHTTHHQSRVARGGTRPHYGEPAN